MHNVIFQVSATPIEKEDMLNESTIANWQYENFADYVGNVERTEEQFKKFDRFPNLFKHDGDTLIYQGEGNIRQLWLDDIKQKYSALNKFSLIEDMTTYKLSLAIDEPFTSNRFLINNWDDNILQSGEFLKFVISELKKGDKLYIGGILDFHY